MKPSLPPVGATITVCIATYRRPALLDALLDDLGRQTRPPRQIVVVDNDPEGSARATTQGRRAALPGTDVVYDIQPLKNISLTRNRTLALAHGDWIAFIDDDERAPADWLALMEATAHRHGAEGVLAPVEPVLPDDAAPWVRRCGFHASPRMATGTLVPRNVMRIGNALIAARRLAALDPAFDPEYGLTGGEDGDMLMRLANDGVRFVWCDEAVVSEPTPASRLRLAWILKRALRGGQDYARHFRRGRLEGPPAGMRVLAFFGRAAAQMVVAGLLAVCTLPLGRHVAVRWAAAACANFGKLSVLGGWHYREYA